MRKRLSRREFLKLTYLGLGASFVSACDRESPTILSSPTAEDTSEPLTTEEAFWAPDEEWWLKPQTYHNGEGPNSDLIPQMNITVLHDWGSLWATYSTNAGEYWSPGSIQERWDQAHQRGMRVEAVVSILDMFFVVFGPNDEVYETSAVDLLGDHIEYDEPVGFVGCTNQPGWLDFIERRIYDGIDWGVDGIIIDDYEGSSRWTSGTPVGLGGLENGPGGCFCSACLNGFRQHLNSKYSQSELEELGIINIGEFSYAEYLLSRNWTPERLGEESRKFTGWENDSVIEVPLYEDYAEFQSIRAVEFNQELKNKALEYALETQGKALAWSVNMPETSYGTHRFLPIFDRNVGGINDFGYPPMGNDGHHYRLGFNFYGAPRLRETPLNPVVVSVMNKFRTTNLWTLKGAEAYANNGALIEYDYFAIEGASDEEQGNSLQNDPEVKNAYNSFVLENSNFFDFERNSSRAKVAVVYSSASLHYDLYRHLAAFNGMCEILSQLNVQFDPILVGDGLALEDNLQKTVLGSYDLVVFPQCFSLSKDQSDSILSYLEQGGKLLATGDFGAIDEYGENLQNDSFQAILKREYLAVGQGAIYHLWTDAYSADDVYDDSIYGPDAAYYIYYVENNHPEVEKIVIEYEEDLIIQHIQAETASLIRNQVMQVVEETVQDRPVKNTSAERVGIQSYYSDFARPTIIVHLLNYDYQLVDDLFNDQEDFSISILLEGDMQVNSVRLLSPDFEGEESLDFTTDGQYVHLKVPRLHIWDIVIIEGKH